MSFLEICHHGGLEVAEASWCAAFLVNLLHLLKDHSQPVCWLHSLRPLAIKIHDVMKQGAKKVVGNATDQEDMEAIMFCHSCCQPRDAEQHMV